MWYRRVPRTISLEVFVGICVRFPGRIGTDFLFDLVLNSILSIHVRHLSNPAKAEDFIDRAFLQDNTWVIRFGEAFYFAARPIDPNLRRRTGFRMIVQGGLSPPRSLQFYNNCREKIHNPQFI